MKFNKLITEKFQNFCLIYTDGSKIEGKGVGADAFVPQKNLVVSRSLEQYSTVFEAEIEAIEIALDLIQKAAIKDKEERKFAICSDSKAAILSLQNFTSNQNQEVSFCCNTLLQLLQNGYEIQLCCTVLRWNKYDELTILQCSSKFESEITTGNLHLLPCTYVKFSHCELCGICWHY